MRAHLAYLRYVLRHKWYVFIACRACGVPLWQAIIHDWNKFLPSEWFPYVGTFYAPDGSKRYVEGPRFAEAWNHHQKRAPHHWQYWLLTWDRGDTEPIPMPERYMREMVADWWGAGRAITGRWEAHLWYEKNKDVIRIHKNTRCAMEYVMDSARQRLLKVLRIV